jgi:ELWxxDGT repeat protein
LSELREMPTESVYLNKRLYIGAGALWKTDGTKSGTKRISDGPVGWLTSAGDRLYFTRSQQLWTSDGTMAGTHAVRSFGWPLVPRELVGVGDGLLFAVQDWEETSWSLWRSDGTPQGTLKVRSFGPYPAEVGLSQTTGFESTLFFGTDDGPHGFELWRYTP